MVPEDQAEAQFISDRINDYVKANKAALAESEKFDELQRILEYRSRWERIAKDLTQDATTGPTPAASEAPASNKPGKEEKSPRRVETAATAPAK